MVGAGGRGGSKGGKREGKGERKGRGRREGRKGGKKGEMVCFVVAVVGFWWVGVGIGVGLQGVSLSSCKRALVYNPIQKSQSLSLYFPSVKGPCIHKSQFLFTSQLSRDLDVLLL